MSDDSVQAGLYTCLAIFGLGSLASTVFRFSVKWKYQVKFGKDDAAILFSTAVNVVTNVFQLIAILYGLGRHTQFMTIANVTTANKYLQLIVPAGCIANIGTKLSLGFLITRIANSPENKMLRRTTNGTMIVTVILGVACVIVWATQNVPHPLSKIWDPMAPGPFPNVWKYLGILYAIGGFNIATDLLYSLSPWYFLRHTKVPKNDRRFIQCLMGSGLIIAVVGIVSLSYAKRFLVLVDMTWILVPRYICDMIERNLAVIVANAPSIKQLITQRRHSQNSSHRFSKHTYESNSDTYHSATRVDSEAGPGTWFGKEAVVGPATMEVAVTGGRDTNATNSLELPIEGETPRGLTIMKSVDIVTEFSENKEKIDTTTALPDMPEIPERPRPATVVPVERRGSESSVLTRAKTLSRAQSTTSLNSNRTGRYSLYPPTQPSPMPDSLIPRAM